MILNALNIATKPKSNKIVTKAVTKRVFVVILLFSFLIVSFVCYFRVQRYYFFLTYTRNIIKCGCCSMPMVFYISSRCCGAPVPSMCTYSLQTAACAIRARCGCCSMWMVVCALRFAVGAPMPSMCAYSLQTAACAIRARCGCCSMWMVVCALR